MSSIIEPTEQNRTQSDSIRFDFILFGTHFLISKCNLENLIINLHWIGLQKKKNVQISNWMSMFGYMYTYVQENKTTVKYWNTLLFRWEGNGFCLECRRNTRRNSTFSGCLTIIPRVRMGSESISYSAIGLMGYWLRGHEGKRNNCFSKIQLVGQKYRDKTTLASKTRFSRHCFGFQSRRFSLLVSSTNGL